MSDRARYVIRFHRPVTVGLKYRVVSSGRIDSSAAIDGRHISGRRIEDVWSYEGVVTVKAVHACGKATRIEVKIEKLQASRRGAKMGGLPTGTVVIGTWTGTAETFTVNGKPVSPFTHKLLGFVTSLYDGDATTSDDTFGPKGPKRPGESWTPNAKKLLASIMRKFKTPSLTPMPSNVDGKVTLVGARKVNGLDVLDVAVKTRVDNIAPRLGSIKVTAGSIEIGMRGWLPQDTKNLADDSHDMTMRMHFEGDIVRGPQVLKFVFDYDHSQKTTTTAIP